MGLADFAYGVKWFFQKISDRPAGKLRKLFAGKMARIALVLFASLAFAVPLAVILAARIATGIPKKEPRAEITFEPDPIAAPDLFIPDEPDFLPQIILEQEQRTAWTNADAAEFWTDPLEFSDEFWRQKVSESIDRLLEPLP